jgi:hypothetical protein
MTDRAYLTATEAQALFFEPSDSRKYNNKLAQVLHEEFVGCEDQSFGQSGSAYCYNWLFSFHDNTAGSGPVLSHVWMTENNDGFVYATLYDIIDNIPRAFDDAEDSYNEDDDGDDDYDDSEDDDTQHHGADE